LMACASHWALPSPLWKTLRSFKVTIIGYTIRNVSGTIACLRDAGSKRTPQANPNNSITGMAMNKFLFNVMSNFHMGESYLLHFQIISANKETKNHARKKPRPGGATQPGPGPQGIWVERNGGR